MVTKGVSTIIPLLGGLFIEEKIEGDAERHPVRDAGLDRLQHELTSVRGHADREYEHRPHCRDRNVG